MESVPSNLDLLSQYEEVWRQSRLMQGAARNGDWDQLIELEQRRATIGIALIRLEQSDDATPAEQLAKAELIRKILASDQETRQLILPRQHELKTTFRSIDTARRLQNAYDMTG